MGQQVKIFLHMPISLHIMIKMQEQIGHYAKHSTTNSNFYEKIRINHT